MLAFRELERGRGDLLGEVFDSGYNRLDDLGYALAITADRDLAGLPTEGKRNACRAGRAEEALATGEDERKDMFGYVLDALGLDGCPRRDDLQKQCLSFECQGLSTRDGDRNGGFLVFTYDDERRSGSARRGM